MAIRYGFYPSSGGDRKYSASDFGTMLSAIHADGVFPAGLESGGAQPLYVTPSGNNVIIGPGRAWFRGSWLYVDTPVELTLNPAHPTQPRYDVIYIRFDRVSRTNSIEFFQGTPHATAPVKPPAPLQGGGSADILDVPIAQVYRTSSRTIIQSDISQLVGMATTPWVTLKIPGGDIRGYPTAPADLTDQLALTASPSTGASYKATLRDTAWTVLGGTDSLAAIHRNTYRGKVSSESALATKIANVRSGKFDDIFIGDTFGNWRVADMNYWLYRGLSVPHLVLIEDEPTQAAITLYDVSSPQTGGYANSRHFTPSWPVPPISGTVKNFALDIPAHIPTAQNSVGQPTTVEFRQPKAIAMNEIMAFGSRVNSTVAVGGPAKVDTPQQLALFRLAPWHLVSSANVGLRDSVGTSAVAIITQYGCPAAAGFGNWRTRLVACVG